MKNYYIKHMNKVLFILYIIVPVTLFPTPNTELINTILQEYGVIFNVQLENNNLLCIRSDEVIASNSIVKEFTRLLEALRYYEYKHSTHSEFTDKNYNIEIIYQNEQNSSISNILTYDEFEEIVMNLDARNKFIKDDLLNLNNLENY